VEALRHPLHFIQLERQRQTGNKLSQAKVVIQEGSSEVIRKIIKHINDVLKGGNSILVHSIHGMNRSVLVTCAYLMSRYCWSADKAMDFVLIKKPTVRLRKNFYKQLIVFEGYLKNKGKKLSNGWFPKSSSSVDSEELLMNNTYINSKMGAFNGVKLKFNRRKAEVCTQRSKTQWEPIRARRKSAGPSGSSR
jgi:hypothetical protein